MWFENNPAYLELLISGYTDRPWYFKTEQIGMNALFCQVAYENNETGQNFVMWDEILQTEEIVMIRDGFRQLLSEEISRFVFHSEYETFAITVWALEDAFEAVVQVQNIDRNVKEQFSLRRVAMEENYNYLCTYCEKYPVQIG